MGLRAWLERVLTHSSHIHLHQEPASAPGDLIDLIDRCLEDRLSYPLEWDDFISWEQANPNLEAARNAIGKQEPWLFSGNKAKQNAYWYCVVEQRNRLAAVLGRPQRKLPALSAEEEALISGLE